ncbi:MAG: Na/Pi symporter [Actinomycetota bacterium]
MSRTPGTTSAARRVAGPDIPGWLRAALVVLLLYVFLAGVKALESGIRSLGEGFTDALFESASNPLAGLFVGILATTLVQSSSVTTATIVALVGSGTLTVAVAIPMVMGANIGTTVTNTLASLGYLRRSLEFRRAFTAATMHDFFNLAAVAVLLPLEMATHYLARSAQWLTDLLSRSPRAGTEAGEGIVKQAFAAPARLMGRIAEACGLRGGALGLALLIAGLAAIFLALFFITRNMRLLMMGRIERSMNAVLAKGAGLPAMAVGLVITVAVQSSSITTAVLVPMVGAGALTVYNAYPVTLGANLGTTVTALLASLAAARPEGLTIALTHTLFNLSGILLWYPVPLLRRMPLLLAARLAHAAEIRKSIVLAYVVGAFVIVPLVGILLLR